MNTLKKLEKRLLKNKNDSGSHVLGQLVRALCIEDDFKLDEIYSLDYEDFELALSIIKDWRLDRYTKTKERLKEMVCSGSPMRRFSRVPFSADIQLHLAHAVHTGHLLDIAIKGALVKVPQTVAADQGVACQLVLPLGADGEQIVMEGVVAHREGPRIGIECRHIDVDSLTNLRRLMDFNRGDPALLERELSHLFKVR